MCHETDTHTHAQDSPERTSRPVVSSSGEIDHDRLEEKRAELDRMEDELNYRERVLAQREKEALGARPANWPRCKPIIHHDIAGEIPGEAQTLVRRVYYLWLFTSFLLVFNFVAIMTALIEEVESAGPFALACLFAIFSPLLAFYCWYLSLYNGARKSSSSYFVIFFFCFLIHILGCLFFVIGVRGTGAAGFLIGIKGFNSDSTATGAFCLIAAFLWLVDAGLSIFLITRAHQYYRASGHSLDQAKKEVAVSAAKNSV